MLRYNSFPASYLMTISLPIRQLEPKASKSADPASAKESTARTHSPWSRAVITPSCHNLIRHLPLKAQMTTQNKTQAFSLGKNTAGPSPNSSHLLPPTSSIFEKSRATSKLRSPPTYKRPFARAHTPKSHLISSHPPHHPRPHPSRSIPAPIPTGPRSPSTPPPKISRPSSI